MALDPAWFADFYDENYLQLVGDSATPDQAKKEVDFILSQLAAGASTRIADIGCGTGRHVHEFAKRGLETWGFDLNPKFISAAETHAPPNGQAHFKCVDMRDELPGFYGLICCFYNSFGFFSDDENQSCLGNWANALQPGGYLYLDLWNAGIVRSHGNSERSFDLGGGHMVHEAGELSDNGKFIDRTYTFQNHRKNPIVRQTRFRLYGPDEIENQLTKEIGRAHV